MPFLRRERVLADLGGIQSYHPTVRKSYYATEERSGVGAARVCEFPGGMSLHERATEWREGSGYTLEIVDGRRTPPFTRALGRFDVEPVPGGTRVRFAFDYGLKFGALGRLMDRFAVRPQFTRVLPGVLSGLRDRVEAAANATDARQEPEAAA